MIVNRLIYVLTLALSFVFYMLYPPWISWYMLVLVLLMIPVDLIFSLPGMLTKGLVLSIPDVVEKDEDAVLTLITTHIKSYPVRCLVAKLHVIGDGFSVTCRIKCLPERNARREVTIDTSHSGVTTFLLKRIKAVSLLGLFSLPVSAGGKGFVLILPQPTEPANTRALQHGTNLRPKPGGGYSEEHDIRNYQHGDPIKSIHWKVSAKLDSLVIREPLEPPPHSRLVHVMPWSSDAERDLILGRLRWVSEYLLKWQLPFYIRFDDNPVVTEVAQESDLFDYLCYVLGNEASRPKKHEQIPSRFSWVFRIDTSEK
jgi:uncharacterized protein (DUF58 family)